MSANTVEDGLSLPGSAARRAVVVLDMVESVRVIADHEASAVVGLRRFVDATRFEVLPKHNGTFIKSTGDGILMAFADVSAAVSATMEAMRFAGPLNRDRDAGAQIRMRAAIALSNVVVDDIDARGAGVNVAYRLISSAEPDQILLTDEANEQLHPALDVATEDLGDRWLKHLKEPVRTYQVCAPAVPGLVGLPLAPTDILQPSIAVLPFRGPSNPTEGLAVGDLIANELICALSGLPDLRLVSRLSTEVAARRKVEPMQAAGALACDYVVSGSCHQHGEQVLVHTEVVDARRGEVLDRFRHTGSMASLLSDESPIVTDIVARLGILLLEQQVRLAQRCALPNLAGYTLLLGGIGLMHRLARRDFERARTLLEHLIERWPRLSAPHAWLARWHLFSVIQGWSAAPAAERQAAQDACDRALHLDDSSSVALAVAGSVRIQLSQDVDGGIDLYEQALRHNPSDSFAWTLMGTAHAFKGEGNPATRASGQALRLSPLDPMHFLYDCHAASAALAAQDYPRALALAERSMRANVQHLSTYRVLALAQSLSGDGDAARGTVRRMRSLDPKYSVATWLRQSPSARYEIGRMFARVLADAGLPEI